MNQTQLVLIMAGGTGGHVIPALAVADELKARGIRVVWLGTKAGIEARLVPQAEYPIKWLSITGLRGKNKLTKFLAPWRLARACWQAMKIMRQLRPAVVLGMGGFVSGPGGFVAWMMRKPLVIHEQNAISGLTNKILAKMATTILQAFPHVFPDGILTGNPVRKNIFAIKSPEYRFKQDEKSANKKLKILVIGGSLGAAYLNKIIPQAVAQMNENERPEIIHQVGEKNYQVANELYQNLRVNAKVEAFINDMPAVYAWADLVICRSGAMTVFELAAAGVASVLVPYPHAVDDHQTQNAAYLATQNAAIIKQETDLDVPWLVETILKFSNQRELLLEMAIEAKKLAINDATKKIANHCLKAGGLVI